MSIKKRLRMSLAASLFFLASISAAQAQYSGGSGTADDPYQIATAPDLIALGETPDDYDKHFKLMADINMADLGETSFAVIGSSEEYPFRGVFDGNHHTVYNLVHNPTDVEACGLFGFIDDPNAEVRDLELADPNIGSTDTRHAGSVAGMLKGGVVRNCGVTGGIVEGRDSVGGLVGRNRAGTIYNSYASVTVLGGGHIGGLIGQSTEGMISACWATGEIAGYTDLGALGGLVGVSGSPIVNCYASTSVTGNGVVGGLVGRNDEATIVNSYAAGLMPISEVPSGRGRSGSSALRGGLVGYNNRGAALNSFWDVETSGISRSDGGIGKTTAQMQDPNTFLGW
ncbi:MAG: GLUG motif-containing protein, partial [Planctomycetota bacterium]